MKISSLIFFSLLSIFVFGQNGSLQQSSEIPISTHSQIDFVPMADEENELPLFHDFHIKYKLEEPNDSFELPDKLKEISALSFDDQFQKLYVVQDENGLVFIIDKKTGEVEQEIEFHKDGDYEGIEVVGEVVYIVKSTGTVYELKNFGKEDQEMEKYNLFLSRENDVEGLCFDPLKNKLLMACKGVPATGESFEVIRNKKVVYGFDIDTKEIDSIPMYNIQLDGIEKCLHSSTTIKDTEKLHAHFVSEEEELNFSPSGIAIHPQTKNVYVLSSAGKTMIVLNPTGEVIYIERLNKEIHRQPEGIAFDQDGTLYISNEGNKKSPAKIYRFDYIN